MKTLFFSISIILLLVFIFSCEKEEDLQPDVNVTFSFDGYGLEQITEPLGRMSAVEWTHVFGGEGYVIFSEVNGKYEITFNFDGEDLPYLSVKIPPGTYDIELGFNSDKTEKWFPFDALENDVTITSDTEINLTATTDYGLILVRQNNLGTTKPNFDGNKDYIISNPGNGDEYLDIYNEGYYFQYVEEAVNGILNIYYGPENTLLETDLLIEAGQMYIFNIVEYGVLNINIDFSDIFEEQVFEFSVSAPIIEGFTYQGSLNGHHYYYYPISTSWTLAYDICMDNGGYLPVVTSQEENDFILSITSDLPGEPHVWIGLTDRVVEGVYEWINGEPVDYTNWSPGQPIIDDSGGDYTILHSSNEPNPGTWGGQYDSYNLYPFLMEIEL